MTHTRHQTIQDIKLYTYSTWHIHHITHTRHWTIQDITLYTYSTWHIQDITHTRHDTLDHTRHDTYVHGRFPLSNWIAIVPFDSCQVLPGYLISAHHSYVFLKSRGGSKCGEFHTDKQTSLLSERGQGEVVCRRFSMVGAWPWARSWRSHGSGGTPRVCHREWKKRLHPWDTLYQFSIKTLLLMRACDPWNKLK